MIARVTQGAHRGLHQTMTLPRFVALIVAICISASVVTLAAGLALIN